MSAAAEFRLSPEVGGYVRAIWQRDGCIDLSVVAPEGPSAAIYLSVGEFGGFALDVLAHTAMESGQELGELIEERRTAAKKHRAARVPGTSGQ